MLDKSFKSRLSKLSSKKKDDQVVQEFVLTYTSTETVQTFLSSLDEAYDLCLRHPFISVDINWKKIYYDIRIPFLQINFDELKMGAVLIGINVSRKVMRKEEVFKYELIFNKEHNPEIDSVFAITYLNRKEENEKGVKVFLEYDTNIIANLGTDSKKQENFEGQVSNEFKEESKEETPEQKLFKKKSEQSKKFHKKETSKHDIADEVMDLLKGDQEAENTKGI